MKKIHLPLLFWIGFISLAFPLSAQHFLNDSLYREQVKTDFLARKSNLHFRTEPLLSVFNQPLSVAETEALQFLYAYMPLSDLADYNGEFFLKQVRTAFAARQGFAWGNSVPEEIFRHFVLVYRVNNENLDNAREVFFNELRPRLQGLSMYEAALEVNHWCHEKVAYRPSDGRTSSPLATVRTALGRCGEESTFTVTALRAVGIPARQCYTPRWAHTDDNHAWVEVWIDGKWYFLGACEPDPELNMGWFAIPSTRTMMVHSNAFGKYNGTEEVTHQTDLFSRVNMLPNYTDTQKITITVTDQNGRAVEGATVAFKLYNYAEYYPIAVQKTDANGNASITTGFGDLLIWATDNNHYAYQKIDVRATSTLTLALTRTQGTAYVEELTIVPPVENHNIVTASAEKVATNARRLQYEDSLRNAYIATFQTEKDTISWKNPNLSAQQMGHFLKKCEGNYPEWKKLLAYNATVQPDIHFYEFINSLSDKDLRDFVADTLQAHITRYEAGSYDFDTYIKGIISPRIANEGLRAWRAPIRQAMQQELQGDENVANLMRWIQQNITLDESGNYFNCPISPMGVYALRRADSHSRNIFFVACCRALNIPAYLDNATNQLFVYEHSWREVSFLTSAQHRPTYGKLVVDYQENSEVKPVYWTHFTIAKYSNGDFVTFDYEDDPRVGTFPFTLELETGYYLLSTGNRYSDGTTLSRLEFFTIEPNQTTEKKLVIRELTQRQETYGQIATDFEIVTATGKCRVAELLLRQQALVCFIDPTREPTKHLLNEIAARKSEFEKWNHPIIFAVPSSQLAPDFNFAAWKLPKQSVLIEDVNNQWFNNIITSTDQYFRDNYPVVFLINADGTLVFKTEGYRIGTAELILKSVQR